MKDPRDTDRSETDARAEAATGREALEEMDRRLGGMLGALAETLGKVIDAVETGEAPRQGPRSADARGGLASGSVVRVRVGGVDVGGRGAGRRSPVAGGPAQAEESRRSRAATETRSTTDPWSPEGPPAESPRADRPSIDEEPAVARSARHDVHVAADAWVLTAEIPGASEADLRIWLHDGSLRVETDGPRPWRLDAPAPAGLSLDALQVRLVNGILEIRAPRGVAPEGGA